MDNGSARDNSLSGDAIMNCKKTQQAEYIPEYWV
jgi:hypothetical protein